jgi:carboxypeptidase PM20D1
MKLWTSGKSGILAFLISSDDIAMKKILGFVLLLVIGLAVVTVYRAETVFEDRQPEPAAGYGGIAIDARAAVGRFARALTFPTVSYDDRSRFDGEAFRSFAEFLESAYPVVAAQASRTIVNGYSLVYHLPGSDPSLPPVLFMSHFDVVPVEESTLAEWTYPPFSGTVRDDTIWGRGSVDDKIGVIALMESLDTLLGEGLRPQRSIYFAFGHDEEVSGRDGAAMIAKHFEGQGIRFDFVLDEGGAMTRGMLAGIDRPVAVVGISEKGYVNLAGADRTRHSGPCHRSRRRQPISRAARLPAADLRSHRRLHAVQRPAGHGQPLAVLPAGQEQPAR